jgi:hypothetical protein
MARFYHIKKWNDLFHQRHILSLINIYFVVIKDTNMNFTPISTQFYCTYCGASAISKNLLENIRCLRHPNGIGKGNHLTYKGTEKEIYTCRYCGLQEKSILVLTANFCPNYPYKLRKGRHCPEL